MYHKKHNTAVSRFSVQFHYAHNLKTVEMFALNFFVPRGFCFSSTWSMVTLPVLFLSPLLLSKR